jgi:hypothetical protein
MVRARSLQVMAVAATVVAPAAGAGFPANPPGWTMGAASGDGVTLAAVTSLGASEAFGERRPFDGPYQAISLHRAAGTTRWAAAQILHPGTDLIAIAANHGVVVAASRQVRPSDGSIEVAARRGGTWAPRVTLRPPPGVGLVGAKDFGAVAAAVSPSGRVAVAWVVGASLVVSRGDARGWSDPTVLRAAGVRTAFPALAVNDRGDVVAAWWGFPTTWGASRPLVASWSARDERWSVVHAPVRRGGVAQEAPSVAVRPDGRFAVVWETRLTPCAAAGCVPARIWLADGKASLGTLSSPVTVGPGRIPRVALAPTGRTLVAWDSGRGPVLRTRGVAGRWGRTVFAAPALRIVGTRPQLALAMDGRGNAIIGAAVDDTSRANADGVVLLRLVVDRSGGYVVEALRRFPRRGMELSDVRVAIAGVHAVVAWARPSSASPSAMGTVEAGAGRP